MSCVETFFFYLLKSCLNYDHITVFCEILVPGFDEKGSKGFCVQFRTKKEVVASCFSLCLNFIMFSYGGLTLFAVWSLQWKPLELPHVNFLKLGIVVFF